MTGRVSVTLEGFVCLAPAAARACERRARRIRLTKSKV
ncbi:hypothetical protein BURMUCGD2M_6598 [Burkholderia multivorans CGD2M]|nr:hypothetical protein BURMUCGD2M_6598 [Burkholderia multivorans CGD2M]